MKSLFDKLFSGSFSWEYFWAPFRAFDWRDALDIVLIALLFFALFRYARGRRASRLALGVGILVIVYAAGQLLDLYALRYIFGGFFGYGLLMLAVIFQPELRAVVERLGSLSFKGLKNIGSDVRGRSAISAADLDEIVLAVKNMSFSKTGAIIAIERNDYIAEYAESGTRIHAAISARLLQTIFFEMTPLHDGAVIIRDGRIFAAGCNLPLTTNTDPIKDLGMRHRAAVGASETSDAVIIVVSEQTGIISVACRGELLRNFTSVTLHRKLVELLGMQKTTHMRDEEQL